MKKSTIVLALLVCAFTVQGAFGAVDGEDDTGYYTVSGFDNRSTLTDYNDGIHTIQNTNDGKYSTDGLYSTYKDQTVYSYSYSIPEDLKDYYLQDVCASTSGTYPETSCSITRINQNNDLNDDEFYCWCRLKRIDDKLAYDGWVFNGSRSSAEICAQRCAYFCVANTTYNSNLRSALLSAFGL